MIIGKISLVTFDYKPLLDYLRTFGISLSLPVSIRKNQNARFYKDRVARIYAGV